MQADNLVVQALAVARITRLITKDEITEELRERAQCALQDHPKLQFGISCPMCVSVYAALAVLVLVHLIPRGRVLVRIMALSEAAIAGMTGVEWLDQASSSPKD